MAVVYITQHESYFEEKFNILFAPTQVTNEDGVLVNMGVATVTNEEALAWFRERPWMYRIVEPAELPPAEPPAPKKKAKSDAASE